ITLLIGFSVVLLGNFLLTPQFHEYGAVVASLIGHVMIITSGYLLSQKYFSIPFNYQKDGLLFLGFLGLSIGMINFNFSPKMSIDLLVKTISLFVLVGVLISIFFRDEYSKTIGY